jgi:hypothetical protein
MEITKEKLNTVHDKKHLVPWGKHKERVQSQGTNCGNQEIPFFGGNLLYLLYSKHELLMLKQDSPDF